MTKEIQFLKHMTNPKEYFQCQLPVYSKQYNLKIEEGNTSWGLQKIPHLLKSKMAATVSSQILTLWNNGVPPCVKLE